MLPDTDTAEQQALPTEDAVAFISLDGAAAAAAPKAADDGCLSAQQHVELCLQPGELQPQDSCQPARLPELPPSAGLEVCTRPAADLQESSSRSQASTPTGWRSRVFNTGRPQEQQQEQQQQQQQQQQVAPALPPGCLVLDGEALLWHDYEDEQQQPGYRRSSNGGGSNSGLRGQQQQQQGMRTSFSTPNLVLLADGSQELQQEPQPQLQQQQQQGRELQPMHSSPSCDSLLSLSQSGALSSGVLPGLLAAQSLSSSGAAPKSRLGRPTGETTPRQLLGPQQQQQQQQQQEPVTLLEPQQQQEGVQEMQHHLLQQRQQQRSFQFQAPAGPSADGPLHTFGSNWDRIQQQQQLLLSQLQQQQQQQQWRGGCSPQPGVTPNAGGSGSAHAAPSWSFSRCDSGLSLGSGALGRRLRIHCVTFNMNGKLPASLPGEMLGECGALGGADAEGSPDLLVFATQENASISEWEKLLAAGLGPGGYERLAWHSLRAIHLVLFAGRRFRRQVLAIRGSAVATGIGNVVGNKGAVALSVELLDLKLLFISSHLAAHGDQVQRRNDDYARIKAGLFAAGSSTNAPPTPRATGTLGSGHSTGRSPLNCRGSLDLPRPKAMSAPPTRAAASDGGGKPGSSSSGFEGGLSGRAGSIPWGGFMRSNRVVDSSAYEEAADRSPSASGRKQVSWWAAQQASGDSGSPSCSSPLLAVNPSAASDSSLLRQLSSSQPPQCSTLAPSAAAAAVPGSQLNKLRVASCPFMEQSAAAASPSAVSASASAASLASSVGEGSYNSSGTASGSESPAWGSSSASSLLGPQVGVERAGSMSSSFLRALVGKQQSGKSSGRSAGDALDSHDVVFWLGDLNYRINGNAKAVRHLMRSRLHEVLHANDQLRLQQKMGTVFQGFQEGQIRFPPTFKFLPGSSAYSEKRVPSWTDRILWKVCSRQQQQQQEGQQQQQQDTQPQGSWVSGDGGEEGCAAVPPPSVSQLYYASIPEVVTSDHKPVVSGFVVSAAREDGGGEEEEQEEAGGNSEEGDVEEGGGVLSRRWCCMM